MVHRFVGSSHTTGVVAGVAAALTAVALSGCSGGTGRSLVKSV
jgi:hypothetical protein